MQALRDAARLAGIDYAQHTADCSASTSACYCSSRTQKAAEAARDRGADRERVAKHRERAAPGRPLKWSLQDLAAAAPRGRSRDDDEHPATLAARTVQEHIVAGMRDTSGSKFLRVAKGVNFERMQRRRFRAFRGLLGVDETGFRQSLMSLAGGVTQDSGKSGSLFWFSADGKYVVKSITEQEARALLGMLSGYIGHFEQALRSGVPCLLARYCAVYRVRQGEISVWLAVMNNVLAGRQPLRVYDLKGTTEDRWVQPRPGKVMKDLNFADRYIRLSSAEADLVNVAIQRDSYFLRGQSIMDYSLLVGIHPRDSGLGTLAREPSERMAAAVFEGTEVVDPAAGESEEEEEEGAREHEELQVSVQVGIIDILAQWTAVKIAAHVFKKPTLGCFHEIDTEPPEYYQERFSAYFASKFLADAVE